MSRSPELAEVIREAIAEALEDVHTAIPARVTRYDAATQQADVQPLIKVAYLDETGERVAAVLPTVRNCPVQFPGGGGFTIIHPIAVGDTGLLVFSEASLDKWLSGAGAEVDPDIDLRHHLSDGVFVPGVRPFGAARASHDDGAILAGADGGAFQGSGLGANIASYLTLLDAWLAGLATAASYPATRPAIPTVESSTMKVTP